MVKNFVIPLAKDELLTSHADQYFVEEIVPLRTLTQSLDVTRSALQAKRAHFILDHFDTFFSVIVHDSKVELDICLRAFNRIHKGVEALVDDLEQIFDHGKDITEEEDRQTYLCITKMLAYLLSWFTCHIDERVSKNTTANVGKRKKTKSSIEEDWEQTRQKVLELLYRWLQIPLFKLWRPPIVENSFVSTVAQMCYKILEQCKDAKQKYIRQNIFEILGTLIKKYSHGITCVVRIIQLVKLFDTLAVPIAVGVVHMVTECGCNGLIREVMNEIGHTDIGEVDSRNVSTFLENIAILQPNLIIPILDEITDYMSSDFYTMRNCVIGVLGAVVQKALTGENLTDEQRERRDECLDILEEYVLDCNAYVRSKILQTWLHLCCEGAVPLARYGKLLAATALRLEDKSANVRKQALQLLRALLQSNPFAGKLNCVELTESLEKEKTKLQELLVQIVNSSNQADKQKLLRILIVLDPDLKAVIKKILESDETQCANDIQTNENKESDKDKIEQELEQNNKKEEINTRKRVINYLENCLEFATELEKAIPIAKRLLFSTCAGDAVESCTFLGTAFQFGVTGTADSMREALFQVFHRDQSVRNNVATVYKDIYLNIDNDKRSDRQVAVVRANRLIDLLKELKPGQSPALAELVATWYEKNELNSELLQILWEKFSMKYPATSPVDSRAALMILTMIAQAETNIVIDNLDVLVKVGLGPRAREDLLLARDTCRMFLKIKHNNNTIEKPPLRYPNNHDMFREILSLLIDSYTNAKVNAFISFATDAINAIYHLANKPDELMKDLLLDITKRDESKETNHTHTQASSISYIALSKLLYVVGHVAIKQMIHLDMSVYRELKRRNALREMRGKNKKQLPRSASATPDIRQDKSLLKRMSVTPDIKNKVLPAPVSAQQIRRRRDSVLSNEDNGEEALEGAIDDAEAEFIHAALENEIVTGNGVLAKFVPLVLDVCQYPDKYNNNENLQAAGSVALCKMMTVSSEFCEKSLQLLVTILERSPYPGIRSNMLIGLSDLAIRFPNQVEPWSKHIYGRLRDEDVNVRRTCVRMLSNLIMKEMIRVKGQVSELVLCIIDEDEEIRQNTKEFFTQLAKKGNTLYNIVPDILSRLADPELNLSEKEFQETIRYILGLMQKERQIDTIIDKICARFKLAATERQWRDLSYCLSLLQFSGKNIRRLIESLPLLKEKIHYKPVQIALQSIIEQTKKRADAKDVCTELEEKIQELLEENSKEKAEMPDTCLMPPPPTPDNRNTLSSSKKKRYIKTTDSFTPSPSSKRTRNAEVLSASTRRTSARLRK